MEVSGLKVAVWRPYGFGRGLDGSSLSYVGISPVEIKAAGK